MSFPRYPEYKDSGVEWLGEVPAHWDTRQLRRLLAGQLANGIFKRKEDFGDGVLLINVFDAYQPCFKVHFKALDRVRCDEAERRNYAARTGDILFVRSSLKLEGIAVTVLVEHPPEDAVFECHLIRSRFRSNEVAPRFASFLLSSTHYRARLTSLAKVTTMTTIEQESLNSLPLLLPPLDEQVSIAAYLDRETGKIDALIAEQERLVALLKEKRQALISHAVTKGLDSNVPMKDSGIEWLGKVPAHWKVTRLKFLASVQTGVAKGKDYGNAETVSMPYLRVANVQHGHIDLTDVAEITIAASDVDRYLLQSGDVLMNEGGDYDKLGRGAVWSGEINPCIHQNHVFAVRPHGIHAEWLNLITGSDYAQFFFMGQSKQSTNLASISSTNLMELPVVVPPAEEVTDILKQTDKQARTAVDLIGRARRTIELLKERRSALISAAVTGKIHVRGVDVSDKVVKEAIA